MGWLRRQFVGFLHRRAVFNAVISLAGYVLQILAPGGRAFAFFEHRYIAEIEAASRQALEARDKKDAGEKGSVSKVSLVDAIIPDEENPLVSGRHRRAAHAPLRGFTDSAQALSFWNTFAAGPSVFPRKHTPNVMLLTGEAGTPDLECGWSFLLVGDPSEAPTGWTSKDFDPDSGSWQPIALPSHWQLSTSSLPPETRDIPIYTNTSYPFPMNPPIARRTGKWTLADCDRGVMPSHQPWMDQGGSPRDPREMGECPAGLHRRKIELPEGWSREDRIFLVFEGVDAMLRVWIDGRFAGMSKDSALPAEFEITTLLADIKEHTISCEVLRWCDGSYLEDQDKWSISGIYREVYLMRKQKAMIADYRVKPGKDGLIEFEVLCEGVDGHAVGVEVYEGAGPDPKAKPVVVGTAKVTEDLISEEHGQALAIFDPLSAEVDPALPISPGLARLQLKVPNPLPWTAETPSLYTLVISLYSKTDSANPIDTESCRTGFTAITFSGPRNLLHVNGNAITIAGVNRPEFHSTLGRAIPLSTMVSDIRLMKQLNVNAVRTAHYPSHPLFLELCNQAGLYAVDEADLETHGFQTLGQPAGYIAGHKNWRSAVISRVARMWGRDGNHPSVLAWSVGNECGIGKNLVDAKEWLKAREGGRRPVQYESGGLYNDATNILAPMYASPDTCLRGVNSDPLRRPLILCEYAHMMGNSAGCMAQYWKLFRDRENSGIQGGYIWDWADQGLWLQPGLPGSSEAAAKAGDRAVGYGGDFGDLPNSAQFCCNGLLGPDRVPHPSAWEAWACHAPVAFEVVGEDVVVLNRYDFVTLGGLVIKVRVGSDARVNAGGEWVELPDLEKIESGTKRSFGLGGLFASWSSAIAGDETALSKLLGLDSKGLNAATECWIEVIAETAERTVWLEKGSKIAHVSFNLPKLSKALKKCLNSVFSVVSPVVGNSGVSFTQDVDGSVAVSFSDGARASVGGSCGRLLSFTAKDGSPLISRPLDICIDRASTDNDRGGGLISYTTRWKALGLSRMVRKGAGETGTAICSITRDSDSVVVETAFDLVSPDDAALAGTRIPCRIRYSFTPRGEVRIKATVRPKSSMAPLPRAGVVFGVPKKHAKVTWSGLGPYEAYDDRLSCVRRGIWESTPEGLYVPYVVPGECGRRAGVRWLALGTDKTGLAIVCAEQDPAAQDRYGFSALPFSLDALENAKHDFELVPDPEHIYVHFDARTMGCGGYDAWSPNVDEEFLLPSGVELSTELVLVAGGVEEARSTWSNVIPVS